MRLKVEGLSKSFDSKIVLKDINFEFEKGKIYGLLGKNGAGKTTLFNCLSEGLEPDSGDAVLINDNDISKLTSHDIGYVFSSVILPDFLTGYEFIKFYMDVNKDKISNRLNINDYFSIVKLSEEDRHKLIKDYSHGMKNKIQMLLVIILKPSVILLDEPLTSLDVVVALEIKKILLQMRQDHIIIFSTHILQLATDLCDEVVVLNKGELELIDHNMLKDEKFEERIVRMLSEGDEHVANI